MNEHIILRWNLYATTVSGYELPSFIGAFHFCVPTTGDPRYRRTLNMFHAVIISAVFFIFKVLMRGTHKIPFSVHGRRLGHEHRRVHRFHFFDTVRSFCRQEQRSFAKSVGKPWRISPFRLHWKASTRRPWKCVRSLLTPIPLDSRACLTIPAGNDATGRLPPCIFATCLGATTYQISFAHGGEFLSIAQTSR